MAIEPYKKQTNKQKNKEAYKLRFPHKKPDKATKLGS